MVYTRYGTETTTGTVACQKAERNWNRNLSKGGSGTGNVTFRTGAVKNSYGGFRNTAPNWARRAGYLHPLLWMGSQTHPDTQSS